MPEVLLIGGPRDGERIEVHLPWPRTSIMVDTEEDGVAALYIPTDDETAEYVEPRRD